MYHTATGQPNKSSISINLIATFVLIRFLDPAYPIVAGFIVPFSKNVFADVVFTGQNSFLSLFLTEMLLTFCESVNMVSPEWSFFESSH